MAVCFWENCIGGRHTMKANTENRGPSLWQTKGTDRE